MLRQWAKSEDLFLIEEHEFQTALKTKVYPDGTIVHDLRVPLGYWEAKDTKDNLDAEIEAKNAKGYPTTNIIYENSQFAVLIQNGKEVTRCEMTEVESLTRLLALFFSYERPEIADFRKAVEQFKTDLPDVLTALREKIDVAYKDNEEFSSAAIVFLDHAKTTINPSIGEADVREMLIQHILTEEIFNHVFNESDFHRENNVAQQLYELERKFFRGAVKRDTLKSIEPYYAAIRSAAASISAHSEKQRFLKVIYENFYKVYNPDAADRLGVVYTPNEIVRFMIEGSDWLCREHFKRGLIDKDVDILDPCTGTGTYICELLETFRGDKEKLAHKYKNELHANELAILPYYVANLNIEATYAAISGQYAEYPNLCFVDTLDNVAALGLRAGHQHDMFAAVSDENIARVKRQNAKRISVIIGNPPYNANQQNENDNNKNRTYKRIDQSIKDSYVLKSTAQKTKVYDMYSRFFRWATDRLEDDGIIAYITNRSFIDSRTFDGFRHEVERVFNEIYVVDLGGDVRANPKLSGTKHNVFGIQTGVAITFLVKRKTKAKEKSPAIIRYCRRPEMEVADDKLSFLANSSLAGLKFETITPSKRGNWINQVENEWDDLLPIADKKVKLAKTAGQNRAIFKLFSLGVITARDDWVYDFDDKILKEKVSFLLDAYEVTRSKGNKNYSSNLDRRMEIKWTRHVKKLLAANKEINFEKSRLKKAHFRPFVDKYLYSDPNLNEMRYQLDSIFRNVPTPTITFLSVFASHEMSALATAKQFDYGFLKKGNGGTQSLPRHRLSQSGEQVDNITDWSLRKFQKQYGKSVTKDDIFHYCYAVLHDPVYREKYAINLKREFPRIPFYPDFEKWVKWGTILMKLHINYEETEPFTLELVDEPSKRAEGSTPKAMLRSDHQNGNIRLDADTQLTGVPTEAWEYKLGNRTAIDWVLDQYKEKKPRDPTIREKFNTYKFADYKDHVIDLLKRVTTVSVETVAITNAMAALNRKDWEQ
jgi:predicted helicase